MTEEHRRVSYQNQRRCYVQLVVLILSAIWLESDSAARATQRSAVPENVVDDNGVAWLRQFSVPFSALGSDEAKRNFVDFVRGYTIVGGGSDIESTRKRLDEGLLKPGIERLRAVFPVNISPEVIGGVQTDVVVPASGISKANSRRVLINLHGGGFAVAARFGGQMEAIPIASIGEIKVVTVDYRQGPEHRFPAASEDVARVYRELLKQYSAQSIGIYGCSAGGMLAAESVAWFQTHQLPRPGAIGIFGAGAVVPLTGDSIYTGLALTGSSIDPETVKKGFPYFDVPNLDMKDALISPAYHLPVLSHFPPTLLVTGTRDIALSSTAFTHTQLIKAGVPAELYVWEGAPHCSFAQPVADPNVPESREAWSVIAKFFQERLSVN